MPAAARSGFPLRIQLFLGVLLLCLGSGTARAQDADGDGVPDVADNCVQVANADQADADAGRDDDSSLPGTQHYGDACDADLDDDGLVGASDFFGGLRPCLGADLALRPECREADLDGDGVVGPADFFSRLRPALGQAPGPGVTEPTGAPPGTNRVLGRVEAQVADQRLALPGATIRFEPEPGALPWPGTTTSDAAGGYEAQVGLALPYRVCAEAPGFATQCHPEPLPFDAPSLAPEVRDFVLLPAGDAVRGHVLLSDGTPCAEDVAVSLFDATGAFVSSVQANIAGGYVLAELGAQTLPRFTFEARCSSVEVSALHSITPEERAGLSPVDWTLPNAAPEIQLLRVLDGTGQPLRVLTPLQAVEIATDTTDPDGDPLAYSWSNDADDLVSMDQPVIPYTAPSFTRTDRIHLQVSDGRGGVSRAKLAIRVGDGLEPFAGFVRDLAGDPIAGALVDVDGITTQSDTGGGFQLRVPAADFHRLHVSAPGFQPWIERMAGAGPALELHLVPFAMHVIDPTTDNQLFDGERGVSVFLPAGSLVGPGGTPPTGLLEVGLATTDGATGKPLGSRLIREGRLGDQTFVPRQMASVEIHDALGNPYQLAPGAEASIGFQAADLPAASQPRTLSLGHLDEATGVWELAGRAVRRGSRFEAEVSSFSSWSAGSIASGNTACLHVHVNQGSLQLPARLRVSTLDLLAGPASFVDEYVLSEAENAIYRLPPGQLAILEVRPFSDPDNVLKTVLTPTGPSVSPAEPPFPYDGCMDVTVQAGIPMDGSGNSQQFLWRRNNTLGEAIQYYQDIGAVPGKSTFAGWMTANGFGLADFADDVVFFNPNELGLTRRANCKSRQSPGLQPTYACYVTKYGHVGEVPGASLQEGIAGVAAGDTVAMEFSPTPTSNGERVVQFFVYEPGPSPDQMPLATDTKFDDDPGKKYVPGVCMNCHGIYEPQFVVFDAHEYEYPPTGPYTLASQQERLRQLNAIVDTVVQANNPGLIDNPAHALMDEIYGAGQVYVPGTPAQPALKANDLWSDVVKPYCRTCHMWHPGFWKFEFTDLPIVQGPVVADRLCQGMMPHALAPMLGLWSSSDPFLPSLIGGLPCVNDNQPPTVQITSPADGSTVSFGGLSLTTYTALASDAEDGASCCAISWRGDGVPIGFGGTLQYTFADAGPHVVCAHVSDSNGKSDADCIDVVSENDDPFVVIQQPQSGTQLLTNTPASFWATAFDPNEPYQALDCGAFDWSFTANSLGAVAPPPVPGDCQPEVAFPVPGNYLVSVQAADPDGGSGSDQIAVSVADPPPGTPPSVTILAPGFGTAWIPQQFVPFDALVTSHGGGSIDLQWSLDEGGGRIPLSGGHPGAFVPEAFLTPDCGSQDVEVILEATDSFGTGEDARTIEILWPAC